MLGDALAAAALPIEAFQLLRSERHLRRLAFYPALLSLLLVGIVCVLAIIYGSDIASVVHGTLPALEADKVWQWIYVGPVRLATALVTALAVVLLFGVTALFALLLGGALAAPFRDALSAAVERHVAGAVPEPPGGVWILLRDGGRAILEALARLAILLVVWGSILVLSFLLPIASWLSPFALAIVTALFATLDYSAHSLDRRELDFPAKARWVRSHRSGALGLGGACVMLSAIPLVNLVIAPVLVVAGTLFVLRRQPDVPAESR